MAVSLFFPKIFPGKVGLQTCINLSAERFSVFPRQRWTIPAMMMRKSVRTFVMEKISVTLAANLTLEQLIAVRKPERRK